MPDTEATPSKQLEIPPPPTVEDQSDREEQPQSPDADEYDEHEGDRPDTYDDYEGDRAVSEDEAKSSTKGNSTQAPTSTSRPAEMSKEYIAKLVSEQTDELKKLLRPINDALASMKQSQEDAKADHEQYKRSLQQHAEAASTNREALSGKLDTFDDNVRAVFKELLNAYTEQTLYAIQTDRERTAAELDAILSWTQCIHGAVMKMKPDVEPDVGPDIKAICTDLVTQYYKRKDMKIVVVYKEKYHGRVCDPDTNKHVLQTPGVTDRTEALKALKDRLTIKLAQKAEKEREEEEQRADEKQREDEKQRKEAERRSTKGAHSSSQRPTKGSDAPSGKRQAFERRH